MHFSLLPKYRGIWPVPHAIINGEDIHGITLHFIDTGMDTGDIAMQEFVPIYENDTGYELYHRCEDYLERLARERLLGILISKEVPRFKQDESKALIYSKKDLKEKRAELKYGMQYLYNFVLAFDFPPYEPSFIEINSEKFYLTTIPIEYGMKHGECRYWPYRDFKIYLIPEERFYK